MPRREPAGPRRPPPREPGEAWTPPPTAPPGSSTPPAPSPPPAAAGPHAPAGASQPRAAAGPQPPAQAHDDFWDRISEEVAADAEREQASPPGAAAGPLAMGGDLWHRPKDEAAEAGPGDDDARPDRPDKREASRDPWSAWQPSLSDRPDAPPADDEDGPPDHADADAHPGPSAPAQRDETARDGTARDEGRRDEAADDEAAPDETRRDEAPERVSAAEAEEETGAPEEESEEEEEAAPSPWSIPLTLVGDLDFDEEDDLQPAGPESPGEDGGTETSSAGEQATGERPAPERAGSDLWSRPTWASGEKTRTGPGEAGGGSDREEPDRAGRAGADAAADSDADRDADRDGHRADSRGGHDGDAATTRTGREPDAASRPEDDANAGGDGRADVDAHADGDAASGGDADNAGDADTGDADDGGQAAPGSTTVAAGQAPGADSKMTGTGQSPARPAGMPPARLFDPAPASFFEPSRAASGSLPGPGPVKDETTGPDAAGAAGSAEQAGSKPAAGSGADAGGPGPAAAGEARSGPADHLDDEVVIVPGVARYHRGGCILIRFLGSDDLETSTAREAEANGCVPCRACEPEKPLSAEV